MKNFVKIRFLFLFLSSLPLSAVHQSMNNYDEIDDNEYITEDAHLYIYDLPNEIVVLIAEYLPSRADVQNMALALRGPVYLLENVYWEKKFIEVFGTVKNQAVLKILASSLGKRKREANSSLWETKYRRMAQITLAKNIEHLDGARTIIRPYNNNISRLYFVGANFAGANLVGKGLSFADYSRANFSKANLSSVILLHGKCQNADFSEANLERARFDNTDFTCANFTNAKLINTDFMTADLTNANFAGADISAANFNQAILVNANFAGADISAANFNRAILVNANFAGAYFFRGQGAAREQVFLDAEAQGAPGTVGGEEHDRGEF